MAEDTYHLLYFQDMTLDTDTFTVFRVKMSGGAKVSSGV